VRKTIKQQPGDMLKIGNSESVLRAEIESKLGRCITVVIGRLYPIAERPRIVRVKRSIRPNAPISLVSRVHLLSSAVYSEYNTAPFSPLGYSLPFAPDIVEEPKGGRVRGLMTGLATAVV
jgi:hypothetical protein